MPAKFPLAGLLLCSLLLQLFACQPYLPTDDTLRLHDIWGLKKLNNKSLAPEQVAVLELFVADQRLLLSVNQKSYQGRFRADATRVAFSKIKNNQSSTTSVFEKELISALLQASSWTMEKNFLILSKGNQEVARFIKID